MVDTSKTIDFDNNDQIGLLTNLRDDIKILLRAHPKGIWFRMLPKVFYMHFNRDIHLDLFGITNSYLFIDYIQDIIKFDLPENIIEEDFIVELNNEENKGMSMRMMDLKMKRDVFLKELQNASLDKRGALLREICIIHDRLKHGDYREETPSPPKNIKMSINDYQWERIRCEKQIEHHINLRQRFRQYLKQNSNAIWYSDGQDFFQEELQCVQVSLIECIYDLINSNQLLSNETNDDFVLELKCEKSFYNNDKLDESMKRIYLKRRYQALINSREILLDDLSISINEDLQNRMIKIRAVCVLDEELDYVQQDLQNLDNSLSKSLEEQAAIRLHQIRAMINVYFK